MQLSDFAVKRSWKSRKAQEDAFGSTSLRFPHDKKYIISESCYITIPVIMKQRIHLFPFRTQKLSSALPKVLGGPPPGRIGSCRISFEKPVFITKTGFFLYFLAYFCAVRQICNLFCLSLNDVKIYNSAVFLWFLSELDAYTKTNRNAAFLLFVAVPEIIKFYLYLILDKFR